MTIHLFNRFISCWKICDLTETWNFVEFWRKIFSEIWLKNQLRDSAFGMKRRETCLALSVVLILFFSIGQYVIAVESIGIYFRVMHFKLILLISWRFSDNGEEFNSNSGTESPFESVTEAYDFLGSENELSPFDYDRNKLEIFYFIKMALLYLESLWWKFYGKM